MLAGAVVLADIESQPGGLPLLSSANAGALAAPRRPCTAACGLRVAGLSGAIARLAERAYGRLDSAEQAAARGLFSRLAGEAPGLGPVPRRLSLDAVGEGAVQRALARLAEQRLLRIADDTGSRHHEARNPAEARAGLRQPGHVAHRDHGMG